MTPRKKSLRSSKVASTWLVSFDVDEPATDEPPNEAREASFVMVVQASQPVAALEACEARLKQLRQQTTLFSDPCTVYLGFAIRLPAAIGVPLLLNYRSRQAREERGWISSAAPEQDVDLDVFGVWKEDGGGDLVPFLDFGGREAEERRTAKPRTS